MATQPTGLCGELDPLTAEQWAARAQGGVHPPRTPCQEPVTHRVSHWIQYSRTPGYFLVGYMCERHAARRKVEEDRHAQEMLDKEAAGEWHGTDDAYRPSRLGYADHPAILALIER